MFDRPREEFETDRLVIRELDGADLEALLPVYTSNPEYLALTEGSAGDPGRYDLGMLERDYAIATTTPGRRMAGVYLKPGLEPVGVVDWLVENPSDGKPWIGLVIVHAERQRQGIGHEALAAVVDRIRERRLNEVRLAVAERNDAGLALAHSAGFTLIETRTQKLAGGEETIVVLERRL
jgi:RimJ/RimL family protein N-acetyltransferase